MSACITVGIVVHLINAIPGNGDCTIWGVLLHLSLHVLSENSASSHEPRNASAWHMPCDSAIPGLFEFFQVTKLAKKNFDCFKLA